MNVSDQHGLKVSQRYNYKHELRRKNFLQTGPSTTTFEKARISIPPSPVTSSNRGPAEGWCCPYLLCIASDRAM